MLELYDPYLLEIRQSGDRRSADSGKVGRRSSNNGDAKTGEFKFENTTN